MIYMSLRFCFKLSILVIFRIINIYEKHQYIMHIAFVRLQKFFMNIFKNFINTITRLSRLMKYRKVFYNIHYTFVKYIYNKHPNTTVTRFMDTLFVIYLFQFMSPPTAHDNRSIVSHDYYHPLVLILRSKQFTHRTTSTTDRTSRYLSHPKATYPSVRISVGLNVCVGAQFRVSAGKHTSASPARCISHATPVFGSSSSSSPRSPLDLSSPSHPLLLDRGHGPRLNGYTYRTRSSSSHRHFIIWIRQRRPTTSNVPLPSPATSPTPSRFYPATHAL